MNWFAKKIFDGGQGPKNCCKSYGYLYNFLKKFKNIYQKLTFAEYDRIGGGGFRAARVCYELNPKQNLTGFLRKFRLRTSNCGAILIEFAVCMPILIILLFYIHDLVKIKRWYSQTEFVAQQFANIIQNISQKRTDKRITVNDTRYAFVLALQSVYPGDTVFTHPSGVLPWIYIHYMKGSSNGTASRIWTYGLYMQSYKTPKQVQTSTYEAYTTYPAPTNINPEEVKIRL